MAGSSLNVLRASRGGSPPSTKNPGISPGVLVSSVCGCVDLEVHAAHAAAGHGGGCGLVLGLLGDHRFGGDKQRGD